MTNSASQLAISGSDVEAGQKIVDFAKDPDKLDWYVVNDNVMGGRSEGGFSIEQGELRFTGRTNTDGGGFSSIRTKPVQIDLSDYEGIRLQVTGDGRRYTWRLTSNARWRGRPVSYWADFHADDEAWGTIDIPFAQFIPKFRGMRLDGPELDPGQITGMGLMIYDELDGPFELRLASVHAYPPQAPFALDRYRWRHRVLVVSAHAEDDAALMAMQSEVASMHEEFADRDMLLVTLLTSGTSMAGDRELTAADVSASRAVLGIHADSFALRLIGKDGSIKLSSESATSIADVFSLIDSMPMRRREQADR